MLSRRSPHPARHSRRSDRAGAATLSAPFLGDPRVIEVPRLKWWLILNRSFCRFARRSPPPSINASGTRSPARRSCTGRAGKPRMLQEGIARCAGALRHASRQSARRPSVVHELIERGVDRLIVLPMYPQYSATTTASAHGRAVSGADARAARARPADRAAVLSSIPPTSTR